MSSLLKEKCALTKLRVELERRKEKLCRKCKGFRYLAYNCRNEKEEGKGTTISQNKFEILRSRVIQCEVEERVIRRQKSVMVKYVKCGKKGHKYKKCLLWMRKERIAHIAKPQKAHQPKEHGMLCKGRSTGKKVEKDRGERDSVYG